MHMPAVCAASCAIAASSATTQMCSSCGCCSHEHPHLHGPHIPRSYQLCCSHPGCARAPAVPQLQLCHPRRCSLPSSVPYPPTPLPAPASVPAAPRPPAAPPPASSCAQLCPAAAPRRPLAAAAPPAAARFSQLPPLTRPVPSYKPPVPPVSKGIVFPSSPHTAILPTGTSGFAGAFGYPLLSETLHFAESAKEKLLPWWCSHGKSSYPTLRGSRAFNRCERATPYFT